jgi:FKBP-type peptidyl-prolyl cis-trans isomerase SlyD
MDRENGPDKVENDVVVSLDYTLKVDGEIVDSSSDTEPIQFIQGQGNVIPGLERQIYGMEVGDSRDVVVSAAEGYGDEDPDAYAEVPREEFPPNIPLEPGVELVLKNEDGEELQARIESVEGDTVLLNFNHPLAGKELHFSVEVVELRRATPDELDHGHVHGEHGHDHDNEY